MYWSPRQQFLQFKMLSSREIAIVSILSILLVNSFGLSPYNSVGSLVFLSMLQCIQTFEGHDMNKEQPSPQVEPLAFDPHSYISVQLT